MQRYPMTPQGHAALEEELKQLKTVDRPRTVSYTHLTLPTICSV